VSTLTCIFGVLSALALVGACSAPVLAQVEERRTPAFELPAVGDNSVIRGPHRYAGAIFQGNRKIPTSTLMAVANGFLDRDLDAADIEQLRIALTRIYTDRGYINSGVVLDTNNPGADGKLHFRVIEGRVTDVKVQGLHRLSRDYVSKRLVRSPDEILNVNTLRERYQLLLDDPLFAHINTRVIPGSAPGEAILAVDVDRSRSYALNVAINNYRPPSIGEKAYDIGGQVRDLTGFGDTIDADVTGPMNGEGSPNVSLGWTIPVNRYGGTVGARGSYARTVISEEPLADLDIRSNLARYELNAAQPVFVTLAQKLSLFLGVARQYDSTSIAGEQFPLLPGAVSGDLSELAIRLGPDYSLRAEHQYFSVRLTLLYAHILNYLPPDVAYEQPTKNSFIATIQALHVISFSSDRFELQTRGLWQKTGARISSLEELPVGGVDSVRAFRANTLLQSNVAQLNVDLRWRAFASSLGLRPGVALGPFFDCARAYDVGQPATTLIAMGGTLRLSWPHFRFDFAGGVRIHSTDLIDQQHGSWQDRGIYAQVVYSL
jgi:hemolysin activation/secretion protein